PQRPGRGRAFGVRRPVAGPPPPFGESKTFDPTLAGFEMIEALTDLGRAAAESLMPLARPSLVDAQSAPADVLAVQLSDSRLRFFLVRHLDEAETARSTRLPIHQDLDGGHFAIRCERIAKLALAHAIGKIADVNIHKTDSRAVSDS